MADTNINAYFGTVAEAQLKADQANSELEEAKNALKAKKLEDNWEEPKEEPVEEIKEAQKEVEIPIKVKKGK